MRIGNLSRAGRPAGGHSGRLLRVLSLAGVGAMLLAAWQILPFALKADPSGRAPTAALTSPETPARALGHGEAQVKRPPPAPAPVRTAAAPETPALTRGAAPEASAPAPAAVAPRVVYSGPLVTSSAAPGAMAGQPPVPATAPAPAAPVRSLAPAPAQTPAPAPLAEPAPRAAPEASPQRMAAAPSAAGRVDLNGASVEELNAIPGAGLIGRAIVRGRPYASPEDLVTKRILNRASYERIKDHITAQ